MRFTFIPLLLLLLPTFPQNATGQDTAIRSLAQEDPVFFLVRHTERTDDVPGAEHEADPHLSQVGHERAALLATVLNDAGLTHIHSSDFVRTRETAAPTIGATGIDLTLYDVDDIPGFAEHLKTQKGRHLVVGHSNTTWDLVEALGGAPGPPIESLEYDRLYMVIMGPAGVRTVLIRFGTPFIG